MRVIGITGKRLSGKSTVARYLQEHYDFTRIRFADPLKAMMYEHLRFFRISEDVIERMMEGDLKETPAAILSGQTPRHCMQHLGTKWGRETIDKNHWVNAWSFRANWQRDEGVPGIVADDTRFPNEVEAIYRFGGIVVHITRPGLEFDPTIDTHESETHELPFNVHLVNDGDVQSLLRQTDYRVARHWAEAA